jgi:hypothetical protein
MGTALTYPLGTALSFQAEGFRRASVAESPASWSASERSPGEKMERFGLQDPGNRQQCGKEKSVSQGSKVDRL